MNPANLKIQPDMEHEDVHPGLDRKPRKKRVFTVLLLLLLLAAGLGGGLLYVSGKQERWGCHGDMRGEQHCHVLCGLESEEGHCADITTFGTGYAPGHIH
ncbi:MAG: hypothetical protein KDI90_04810 [Alphaproteobacteria bacterium]|nr:hypothetical protein [Alphaproteobacteria bacterium]MCB9974350.1 hypothetical protein [Rhodospirillales bacterium]